MRVLAEVARTDPDDDVRAEAVRGLAGLAAEPTTSHTRWMLHNNSSRSSRTKSSCSWLATVRIHTSACRRRPAERFEGAVGGESARAHGATRLRALERLQDADEVLNVALKAEHTDTAVAALERLTDVSAATESPSGPATRLPGVAPRQSCV